MSADGSEDKQLKPEHANDNGGDSGATAARPCPICSRPASAAFRPFCSKRCADVDLHRWLGGGYRVPAGIAEDEADGSQDP